MEEVNLILYHFNELDCLLRVHSLWNNFVRANAVFNGQFIPNLLPDSS